MSAPLLSVRVHIDWSVVVVCALLAALVSIPRLAAF